MYYDDMCLHTQSTTRVTSTTHHNYHNNRPAGYPDLHEPIPAIQRRPLRFIHAGRSCRWAHMPAINLRQFQFGSMSSTSSLHEKDQQCRAACSGSAAMIDVTEKDPAEVLSLLVPTSIVTSRFSSRCTVGRSWQAR